MSRLQSSLLSNILGGTVAVILLCSTAFACSAFPPSPGQSDKITSEPSMTVGFFVVDNVEGKVVYEDIAKQVKSDGFRIIGAQYYASGSEDLAPLIDKLTDAGAGTIWVIGSEADKVSVRNILKEQNLNIRVGFTPVESTTSMIQSASGLPPYINKIVFVKYPYPGNQEIYVVNADGSNLTRLTNNSGSDKDPCWSPDGKRIVYSSKRGHRNYQIYVMNADGSNQRRLTRNNADDERPIWSPDGKTIAFCSDRDKYHRIYIMDVDGKNQDLLPYTEWIHNGYWASWSPDGKRITVSVVWGSTYISDYGSDNWRLLIKAASRLAWSPDGTKIAMETDSVYIMNSDGSYFTSIPTHNSEGCVTWSPSGTMIAYDAYDSSSYPTTYLIYIVNIDGSGERLLVEGFMPDWSPK